MWNTGYHIYIFCAINIFLITRNNNNNNQSKSLQDFTLVRPIFIYLFIYFLGANPLLWEILNAEPEWQVWYPAGFYLGQLGRALQWTPKLGFNLPPTVRQWIRVWREHAPRLPSAASLWLSSIAASSTSQALTFLRHFLLQSLKPLAWFSTHWIQLFCTWIIFWLSFPPTAPPVQQFGVFVILFEDLGVSEGGGGGGEEIEEVLWSRKLGNMAKRGLMEQDLSKLDVTILHPLSPEVISRQATINIGNSFPVFSSLLFSVFVFFAPRIPPPSFFSEFPLIP